MIQTIPILNLAIAFIPVLIVVIILWNWGLNYKKSLYAIARMLLQLLLVGYFLAYIFEANSSLIVLIVLFIMILASSWISLGNMQVAKRTVFIKSLVSILIGGGFVFLLITQLVLDLKPWFLPSYMIPLAGMIFANAMNSVSLAGERLEAELAHQKSYNNARNIALRASLIPITNSLLAVGIVSLPGMMTGQILSGVSPFIAARYQIMVMAMIFASAGLSAALFLVFIRDQFEK